ncbi:MAG: RluA family pseudouridine synthase [Clostridia bacterium]|nr:RluA family pseudouridine synthase [Clostridia bacterium]
MINWTVRPEEDGLMLRQILLNSMRLSWSALKSAKWNGQILRNGSPVHMRDRVHAGERIEVIFPEKDPVYTPAAFSLPLIIPYEDDCLMVVDKPAPLASQSSAGHPTDSLENAVYFHLGCPAGFIYRPVNRLDKGTSGLMVIARDGHTQDLLQRQLHSEDFIREYLALTDGIPEAREGVISLPIRKENAASVRRIIAPDGQAASTRYRVISAQDRKALIRLRLETGRTHQIRVHLAALGCPVRGDFLYGQEQPEEFPGRFALHSAYLRLLHPLTGRLLTFDSTPPWLDS